MPYSTIVVNKNEKDTSLFPIKRKSRAGFGREAAVSDLLSQKERKVYNQR